MADMKWIDLAQDRNMWRALVKAVMNLRISNWLVFHEGHCSME